MKTSGVCGPHHPVVREMLSTKVFNKADADASGGLDVDEFKALAAKGPGAERRATKDLDAAFTSIDADGDGSLTKTEMGDAWRTWKSQFRTTLSMHAEGSTMPSTPHAPPAAATHEAAAGAAALLRESGYGGDDSNHASTTSLHA